MYTNSLFLFSLSTVWRLTVSDLSINIHKSPEFTLFRLSLQKGHDSDLPCLQQKHLVIMIEPCREETHSIKNGLLTSHGNTWCIKNVYNWAEQPCCSSPYIYRTLRLSPCQSRRALLFRSPLCFCTVLCIPLSVCGHRCLWYLFLIATAREISQLFHNKGKPISIIKGYQTNLLHKNTWINITIEIFNTGFSLVNRHCCLPIRIGLMQLKGFNQTINLKKEWEEERHGKECTM